MRHRFIASFGVAAAIAFVAALGPDARAQSTQAPRPVPPKWTPPRTVDGRPDLAGNWSFANITPLERPTNLGEKATLTDAEAAQLEEQNAARSKQDEGRQRGTAADVNRAYNDFWYDRGTRVASTKQTSLVVDPPNGRMPPLTADGQKRTDETQARRRSRPSSWEDRSLYDRCLTRGPIGSILPVIYGNGLEIHQTPNDVVIRYEMIHETRIIPLDAKPHVNEAIKMYMGDARGRFEGDTLVVETKNMVGKTAIGLNGNGSPLSPSTTLVERFKRVAGDQIDYSVTVTDPETYTAPFTIAFPITPQPDYQVLPYECHEGNMALANILSAARAEDRAIAEARAKGLPEPKFNNDDGPIFAPTRE